MQSSSLFLLHMAFPTKALWCLLFHSQKDTSPQIQGHADLRWFRMLSVLLYLSSPTPGPQTGFLTELGAMLIGSKSQQSSCLSLPSTALGLKACTRPHLTSRVLRIWTQILRLAEQPLLHHLSRLSIPFFPNKSVLTIQDTQDVQGPVSTHSGKNGVSSRQHKSFLMFIILTPFPIFLLLSLFFLIFSLSLL